MVKRQCGRKEWMLVISGSEMNVHAAYVNTIYVNLHVYLLKYTQIQKKCKLCKFTVITAFKVSKNWRNQNVEKT